MCGSPMVWAPLDPGFPAGRDVRKLADYIGCFHHANVCFAADKPYIMCCTPTGRRAAPNQPMEWLDKGEEKRA